MINALFLPGMDGGELLSRRFRKALLPSVVADVLAYPTDEPLGYEHLESLVQSRVAQVDGPVALIAESFSGPLAIRVAGSAPSNVSCVVLVATFDCAPAPRFLASLVNASMFRRPPPAFFVRQFMLGADASADEVAEVQRAVAKVDAHVLAARLRAVLAVDVADLKAAIEVPVLYLRGTADRLVRRALSVPLNPNWVEEAVEGPHLLLQARPDECASRISRFLANQMGSRD